MAKNCSLLYYNTFNDNCFLKYWFNAVDYQCFKIKCGKYIFNIKPLQFHDHHMYSLLLNFIVLQTGVGPIKIVKGGIQVAGQTWITNSLVTSTITSQPAQPITLHSHRNLSILVSEPNQPEHAKLLIS